MSKKKLTVEEINIALQQAALRDREGVVEDPVAYALTGEPDVEGWDEYVARTLAEDPPEDPEEEV